MYAGFLDILSRLGDEGYCLHKRGGEIAMSIKREGLAPVGLTNSEDRLQLAKAAAKKLRQKSPPVVTAVQMEIRSGETWAFPFAQQTSEKSD